MKARRYCIVYLTLGQKAEQHGYSDTGSLLADIKQIQEMGCEIIDVFRLPEPEPKDDGLDIDKAAEYLSRKAKEAIRARPWQEGGTT